MSTDEQARCAVHDAPSTGVCARCGRFGCAECLATGETPWCRECLDRSEERLRISARAKQALVLALLGFHGLLPALPVALRLARRELADIDAQQAPPAGRPMVVVARAVATAGVWGWGAAFTWLLMRVLAG